MLLRLPVRHCPVNIHTRLSSNLFSKVEIEGQKDENTILEPIRGRENRKLMAPEYISPQYQVRQQTDHIKTIKILKKRNRKHCGRKWFVKTVSGDETKSTCQNFILDRLLQLHTLINMPLIKLSVPFQLKIMVRNEGSYPQILLV